MYLCKERRDSLICKTLKNNIDIFCDNADAEKWTEFVRDYARIGDSQLYGGKHGGSDAEHEGARYIAGRLREIGIPKVELVETPATRYQFDDADLKVLSEKDPMEIKPYGYRSPGTGKEGITGQLIDAGTATRDELAAMDIKGKIAMFQGMDVLEAGNLIAQMEECIANGAKALLVYSTEEILNEDTIRIQTPMNKSPVSIAGISLRHANYLKGLLSKGPVEVNLAVDSDYTPDSGVTYNVLGEIPGTVSEEKIVFSAHLDHFFRCLQDNIASCAALLGIAEAMIKSGYKPRRSILFAFHGSHECALIDSKYPYISGSYETVQQKLPQWKGKVIADINFEYAALELEALTAVSSIGNEVNLFRYLDYSPELTGGFQRKDKGTGAEQYYGLSWCDGISYCTSGIPVYTNDIISEQLEGKSPYIGRDHSNFDDWGSYSIDALRDSIRFYGGFGIYLDSLPYVEIDFSSQSRRMHAETEFDSLDEEGMKTAKMRTTLKVLEETSGKLLKAFQHKNQEYLENLDEGLDLSRQKEVFDRARKANEQVLHIFDYFQSKIDGIAPSDFLISRSGKYLMNVALLGEAEDALKNGDGKAAKDKLMEVDMAGISYYFSESTAERMCRQVCGKEYYARRSWARGRELNCQTLYPLMVSLKRKNDSDRKDFQEEIKMVKKATRGEMLRFIFELKKEFRVIKKAVKKINGTRSLV